MPRPSFSSLKARLAVDTLLKGIDCCLDAQEPNSDMRSAARLLRIIARIPYKLETYQQTRVQEANTCFRAPRLTAVEDDLELGVDKEIAFDPSLSSSLAILL